LAKTQLTKAAERGFICGAEKDNALKLNKAGFKN
jgi:hypothetical protein